MRNAMILFFTNACNAKCRHCFVSPLMQRGDTAMEEETFAKAIELSASMGLERLVFSGGEPFLYWERIKEYLLRHSIESGMHYSLCTNGYWANDQEKRKLLLKELREYNFDALEISTDVFHQEYIDFESCIEPLLVDAAKLGFIIDVTVCYENIMQEGRTINRIKQILGDGGHMHIRPVSGFGRAEYNGIIARRLCETDGNCSTAGEICIRYDGEAYICCGPPIVYDIKEFELGNVLKDSISLIMEGYSNNTILKAMQTGEFKRLVSGCIKNNDWSLCDKCIRYSAEDRFGSCDKKGVLQ